MSMVVAARVAGSAFGGVGVHRLGHGQLRSHRRGSVCRAVKARMAGTALPTKKENLYSVVGVERGASREEIKAAYRRLARLFHPDASAMAGSDGSQEFIAVHDAYSVLYDPQSRADYDRRLATAGAWSALSARRCTRNWETDQCW